ncbi:hypothetical protein [Streptomyces lateritius]|uniref:hypothetical protein n=1 Tax=Streptomyces lateritius TaxID=67313 RepID=UPI0013919A1B|nr:MULTISPECIES: hypothetical protein [Streptomyces]
MELDERPCNIHRAVRALAAEGALLPEQAEPALDELTRRRLLWQEGDLAFGLAVEASLVNAHREGWTQQWAGVWC